MAKPTGKSWVERELRTPKYRSKVEVDEKKEEKINGVDIIDEEINMDTAFKVCDHGYLSGCPFCRQEN